MSTTTTDRAAEVARRADRDKRLVKMIRDGMTLAAAGGAVDPSISGERVRQIVTRIDPAAIEEGRRKREQEAPAVDARAVTLTCEICGREFSSTDARRKTCSGILPGPFVVEAGSTVIADGQAHEVERDEPLFLTGVHVLQVVPPEGGRGRRVQDPPSTVFVQSDTCADVRRRRWATGGRHTRPPPETRGRW